MEQLISWVVCTYNRTPLTEQFMDHNLARLGTTRPELIWIDNSSTDGVERLWDKYNPDIIIKRPNDCLSKSKNAAYAVCRGDWIIDLENDFLMPDNWLPEMLEYGKAIEGTGIMATMVERWDAILTLEYTTPKSIINGKEVIVCRAIGPRIFSREVFKKCGFLIETYGLYGDEDIEISDRAANAGLINYIIPSITGIHAGNGEWDMGEYRAAKDEGLHHPKVKLPEGQLYFNPFVCR